MRFPIDHDLLEQAGAALSQRTGLYWIVGGATSGKTSVCRALSARLGVPVYDMDAHIYGSYHARFTPQRHPANWTWSTAPDGLAWLLGMTWDEFDAFNRAALPEYLDLLAEDLEATPPGARVLIDGGIANPAMVAQALPTCRMACLAAPEGSSARAWQEDDARKSMKQAVHQLPNAQQAWRRFLEFDAAITHGILQECHEHRIPVIQWAESAAAEEVAGRVAIALGML